MFTVWALFAWLVCCVANECPASMDPLAEMREGDDYMSQPLTSNSSLGDCIDLCCLAGPCSAFSFNSPQQVNVTVGNQTCLQGGVCCMLKLGNGSLKPNPYGAAVQSGSMIPLSGPVPPFPASTAVLNVSFGSAFWWNGSGDTWPTTWAADGRAYGWGCDPRFFEGEEMDAGGPTADRLGKSLSPMALFHMHGDPYAGTLSPVLVSKDPINYTAICGNYSFAGNVKPAGMYSFSDGRIVTGISCMNYGDYPPFNRQHNTAGFLAVSSDQGVTWSNVTTADAFHGRFASPMFLSCGQAGSSAACTAAAQGWVYVMFPGSLNNESYWDNNDAIYLARVGEADVLIPTAYQYVQSVDETGPIWTTDPTLAVPVLEYRSMLGENSVTYNPFIGRYLMVNYGFTDVHAQPRPWHTVPRMLPHRTQMTMLEAPAPWGPWSMFYRSDDSLQAPGLYNPSFPSAYMKPLVGGQAQMIMFFSCWDFDAPDGGVSENCRYTLNYQVVTLTLA